LARAQDLDVVTMKRDACKKEYDELRKRRLEEFMTGFNQISGKLKEMYQVRLQSRDMRYNFLTLSSLC
jgi:structural maintenance of chromosome 4